MQGIIPTGITTLVIVYVEPTKDSSKEKWQQKKAVQSLEMMSKENGMWSAYNLLLNTYLPPSYPITTYLITQYPAEYIKLTYTFRVLNSSLITDAKRVKTVTAITRESGDCFVTTFYCKKNTRNNQNLLLQKNTRTHIYCKDEKSDHKVAYTAI